MGTQSYSIRENTTEINLLAWSSLGDQIRWNSGAVIGLARSCRCCGLALSHGLVFHMVLGLCILIFPLDKIVTMPMSIHGDLQLQLTLDVVIFDVPFGTVYY